MLYLFFIGMPTVLLLLWIIHAVSYWGILKKMGLKKFWAFIPFAAEKKIGDTMFETRYAFRHPFLFMLLFILAAMYFKPFASRIAPSQKVYGMIFLIFAFIKS